MKKRAIVVALAFACTVGAGAQTPPYKNPKLTAHERAVDLCSRMTLEEKAAVMMNNIVHGLGELEAAHLEQYNENGSAAIALLPGDDPRLKELACPYLITFHDGFQYFALDNGLTLLKAIEEEEGSEASAAEIKEIVALIEEYDIPAIFTEVNGSDATAQAISRETGCEIYQLDMIMSGDGTGIQPYVDAMEKNMDTILEALG